MSAAVDESDWRRVGARATCTRPPVTSNNIITHPNSRSCGDQRCPWIQTGNDFLKAMSRDCRQSQCSYPFFYLHTTSG